MQEENRPTAEQELENTIVRPLPAGQDVDDTIVRPLPVKPARVKQPEPDAAPEAEPAPEPADASHRVPLVRIAAALMVAAGLLICALGGFLLGSRLPRGGETAPEALYHPLTGAELTAPVSGRLLCAVVDNSPEARPQSGLEQASLVYEMPAEAGIPRLLLCYYGSGADQVGPVRSARPYLVNLVRGWDGLLVCCGSSPEAATLLRSGVVDHVDGDEQSDYFWRDSSRDAPHDLYTSTDLMTEAAAQAGYDGEQSLPAFTFRSPDEEAPPGAVCNWIELDFTGALTNYFYDSSRRAYCRWINDERCTDGVTGEQICAANVIIQFVDGEVLDDEGRLALTLTGSGEALLFSEGRLQRGRWESTSLTRPAEFTDTLGNAWALLPGQTWIELVSDDITVSFDRR
ncbi:MAG: DUF3048 domain-containing protein [Firmicutes bacterium]|nr:DUF3048 domain-containing protein [Bacillota bacterium]